MQLHKLQSDSGSEIAEVAVILPVVIMFLLAIMWFGRAFNIYSTITHAAREGAQVAVQQGCATCGGTVPGASDVQARVAQVLQAARIDPTRIQAYTPTPTPTLGNCPGPAVPSTSSGQVTLYSNVQLNPGTTGPPACGVVVSFKYPFQFFLPVPPYGRSNFILDLKADAQMQGEN